MELLREERGLRRHMTEGSKKGLGALGQEDCQVSSSKGLGCLSFWRSAAQRRCLAMPSSEDCKLLQLPPRAPISVLVNCGTRLLGSKETTKYILFENRRMLMTEGYSHMQRGSVRKPKKTISEGRILQKSQITLSSMTSSVPHVRIKKSKRTDWSGVRYKNWPLQTSRTIV